MGFSYTLNGQSYGASGNSSLPAGAVLTSGRPDNAQEIKAKTIGGGTLPKGTSFSTDSAGNYTADGKTYSANNPNLVIDAPAIGSTPKYQLPQRNINDVGNVMASGNASLANLLSPAGYTQDKTGQFVYTPPKDTANPNQGMDMLGNLRSLMDMTPRKESVFNDSMVRSQQNEVQQNKATVNALTGNLNAITAKAQADQLALIGQGRGIPESVIGGQQAQINREAAIAALPLQAQIAVAQGNLALAQESLDNLIKVRSDEINNDFTYKMQLFSSVKDYVTKAEDRELKRLETLETRAYNDKKENLARIDEWQKMAVKTGQSSLISQFSKLDPSSPTFSADLNNITSKVTDPMVKLDVDMKKAEIDYKNKQTQLLGEPTKEERKKIDASLKEAQNSIPIMKDKVALVDTLSTHEGLSTSVGTNLLSRSPQGIGGTIVKATGVIGIPALIGDIKAGVTGQKQDFAGGVHKLTAGLSLQSLIDAKARGATFGALSEGELNLLSSSATAINDWEIKNDKGIGTGVWNIDEASFVRELNTIKDLTNRALLLSQGTLIDDSEQAIIDNAYNPQNMNVSVDNYFNK